MIAAILAAATISVGLETNFITYQKKGEAYLSDAVAADAYDAARRDPATFCAALRLVAYMQISGDWQAHWKPDSDRATFNSQTLVCPRDLTQPPRWEHLK